jgi:acyl-CoA thioesterase
MSSVVDDEGKTRVLMKVTEELKQFYGNLHGGAIASLLDSAIAVAVNQQLEPGEGDLTVEIKINYLRSINEGNLWGEGKVIQKGRKIVVAQGEIKDDAGQILAIGTATFTITKMVQ